MSAKYHLLISALKYTCIVYLGVFGLFYLVKHHTSLAWAERIGLFLGGDFLGGGYIQFATFFVFILSYRFIRIRQKNVIKQRKYIEKTNLPKSEKSILLESDINRIRIDAEEKGPDDSIINSIVIRACRKFRASGSLPETMDMVSEQMNLFSDRDYVDQTMIRYLNWCIPSIGFIGTILGIAGAMSLASSGNIDLVTSQLGVAFDTTLLALILSIIINWKQGELEKESAEIFIEIKQVITDRLINCIEVK